jgi:Flp pilus assembly protein TadG
VELEEIRPFVPMQIRGLRRAIGRADGQALIEFALSLPFLVLLILALVDFGRAVLYWLNASQVASQGARLAAVWGTQGDCSALATKIKSFTYAGGTVTISFPDGAAGIGNAVTVRVQKSYSYAPNGLIPGSSTLTGASTMRLEQKPGFSAGCTA